MQRKLVRATESTHRVKRRRLREQQVVPERTGSEPTYYLERMRSQAVIKIALKSDTEIRGRIAWYDREVTRQDGAHLVLYKRAIRHIEDV